MKYLFIIITMMFSINSFASYKFKCNFSKYSKNSSLYFQVSDLEKPSLLEAYNNYEGESVEFSYEGEDIEHLWILLSNDEEQGAIANKNNDFVVPIDDGECNSGKLHLYNNSGYQYGYIRTTDSCYNETTYSKVSCTISKVQ